MDVTFLGEILPKISDLEIDHRTLTNIINGLIFGNIVQKKMINKSGYVLVSYALYNIQNMYCNSIHAVKINLTITHYELVWTLWKCQYITSVVK